MIKLMSILNEVKNQTYSYGCVMLYFNFPEIEYLHQLIDPNHLYTEDGDSSYGLETKPHTTLLYGLHDGVLIDDVSQVLNKYSFGLCRLYNPSLFQNEKYDVLKFDVSGYNLNDVNRDLKKFPFTSDYPNYHPHLTIAYLKHGYGSKYVRKLGNLEYNLKPIHGIYSEPNGLKTKIELKINE
jgi:hypothetical protein